ncbi:MBL fold metallo-hydrolase [Amycolatopsis acidiphila]|uniref:MBL fold metallo-hydrolase n=1 Tax=Amycolatopsis acidiphila TaxID=715473 RepID=A0A557ZUA6_9PSEU|nr:MBL fold metallo-hydrolase [Amycolatopsis acidiphila]TVT15570.1 MBL fold metallo-hydrolase [Amycolatopsis acidiphila]UIJ60802.1 MBL fold metallo-hydrolase [Amycolatopsis acidiphila]GHG93996.1 MBL fold metallo-hydrolase [Amycolatopsis acidiphila]
MTRLTVLGSCGAWPEHGRACSGFLLEHDGFRLVLDLGYGTAARLEPAVDAVLVTHAHPDHCVDVSALGRRHHHTGEGLLPLYCPPGVLRVLEALEPRPHPTTVFDVHDLAEATTVGPFRLQARPLPHHVPSFGVRLSAPGVTVAYTGDTGPTPELAELARDADLFIADATLQGTPPSTGPRYLLTAGEAGAWAARANAKRVLLTHFWPGSDRAVSIAEARAAFNGELLAASEGLEVAF